ncbi:hypothetical protein GQ43DRAFT_374208 [Delitschia confertaspora ATCC 74209]|uniref:Cytochrome c oxidase assembly protein n=1 Tax=Delitschia confertaspora ATCC 74209 TaxID=1513339 RepID=A0A9P4JL70_9PLEO|nr:hypothetical protein GQ43DRAFT_374208 [Delitschia confertaspora ATCC 74209]
MSRASKITLATTALGAFSICVFVHYAQRSEKAAMHAGVIRDYEQQRVKKEEQLRLERERQADFEMQQALEKEYRKLQTVSDGGGPDAQGSSTNG